MAGTLMNKDGTAKECFYQVNSLINVDYIKIDTNIDLEFKDALKKSNKMLTTTVLLKNFQKEKNESPSILAKYFSPAATELKATFIIYRKTPDQKYYDYVCSLTNGAYQFLDYNIVNNQYYHYMAWIEILTNKDKVEYLCYEDVEENGNIKYIKTSFDRWTICDIEESSEDGIYIKTGNLWALGLNMDNPEFSHNLSITTWDTLGKYGKVSIGSKNYESSSFTGLLGDMKEYVIYDIPQHGELISGKPPVEIHKNNYFDSKKKEINRNISLIEAHIDNLYFRPNFNETAYQSLVRQLEKLKKELSDLERQQKNSNYLLYQKFNKQVYRYTEKINLKNPYARETEKLKAWKEFCANGNLKLLRDIKGHAWIVQIIDSPKNTISLGDNINQTTISFSWQEIEDVNDCSIVTIL